MNKNDPALSDPYLLAMHFEQVAQDLYASLAQVSENRNTRVTFARLSNEEAGHAGLFRDLRAANASKPPTADFPEQALNLMRTYILPVPGALSGIALRGGRKTALELAMKIEQDSVGFYRDLAPLKPDLREDIATIIQEEQRHSQIITSLLKAVEAGDCPTHNHLPGR